MTDSAATATGGARCGHNGTRQKAPAAREEASIETKVAFLRRPEAYPDRPKAVEVIETHMSWVFLADEHVYKLKKPVRREFLDFTTVEARHENCEREVRLNQRLAPDVYLGVVALMSFDGALRIGGEGRSVDWLVRMRRLPAERMLDAAISSGTVRPEDIRKVARRLTLFYRGAERIETGPAAYRLRFVEGIRANSGELTEPDYRLPVPQVERVTGALLRFLARRSVVLQQRAVDHRIVDAHGDLRPEHICLTEEPKIIDCLEFNREFRLLDPVDELAYLAMECERLGAPEIGDQILHRYLEASGDAPPRELIWFYKAYRACLRAKIAVWHIADHEIQDTDKWRNRASVYLGLAENYVTRR